MKISEDTISILNNFSAINAALLFNEGSDIFTISEAKNILAKASVDETFPREFGIYQLSEFLSAVSLLENPDFEEVLEHREAYSKWMLPDEMRIKREKKWTDAWVRLQNEEI